MRGPICVGLSFVLTATSPGLLGYEAMAAVVTGAASARAGIGSGVGAAGASLATTSPLGSRIRFNVGADIRLGEALPDVGAPAPMTPLPASTVFGAELLAGPAVPSADTVPKGDPRGDAGMPASGLDAAPAETKAGLSLKAGADDKAASQTGPQTMWGRLWKSVAPIFSSRQSPVGTPESPTPRDDPFLPVRTAEELRIMFDGGTRRRKADFSLAPQGAYERNASGLHNGLGGKGVPALVEDAVPAPAPAQARASVWEHPILKAAVPTAVLGAAALVFQAQLIPTLITAAVLMGSILVHEAAHILGLRIWGDKTPARMGRDSINPLNNVDALGTVALPVASAAVSQAVLGFPAIFGWAKPVPVEFNNLGNVRKDAAKVALLGPLANLGLAALAGAAFVALPALGVISAGTAAMVFLPAIKINLVLTAFNLLPFPWSDGGKLLIAVMPAVLYSWWTHNPRVPAGYQSIYQKLYEGPSRLLSMFQLDDRKQLNGLTTALSFAALGAFVYALSLTPAALPFALLALPCSYDYWCIREKVRSEKAVSQMMDLMSEWGSVLAEIADDLDADSDVSVFEAEHAMKNAVDQLLEDLMVSESFRKLSQEEQIKEFMRRYPDMAVRLLREKVFTEDSEDKIREILADERNKTFFVRLEGWLAEHEVFKKMASPHQKKHLKDSMKEAETERAQGDGSSLMKRSLEPENQ